MSLRRPTAACLLFSYPLYALYVVSLRRPTAALLIYLYPFWGVISNTRSVHSISTPVLHIHILYEQPACVHHEFCLWPVTYEDYVYYYHGLTIYIIWIIEYPWDGSTSWIFTMLIYLLSPLCGVAETPNCGMLVIYLPYKPFMWCRSDARLWHACYLFSL